MGVQRETATVIEMWRRWNYKRHEARFSNSENFSEFVQWANGPWTPQMVSKMPSEVLIRGPRLGEIDAHTRKAIDLEIEKRFRSRQPFVANVISLLALVTAIIAMLRT